MKINTIPLGDIGANCYLVSGDSFALVIDPGIYDSRIVDFLKSSKAANKYILLTHSHFDHICGANRIRKETNTDILISEKDEEGLFNPNFSLSHYFGIKQECFYADKTLVDEERINLDEAEILCIETPGHSPGSMCFLIEGCLFSGDTLFEGSIGRTDFPHSNHSDMVSSLKKLSLLDPDIKVFPGHGDTTTIKTEIDNNPFLRNLS